MTKTLEHSALFGSSSQIGSAIPDAFLAPATPRSSSSETELRLAFSAGAVRHGSPSPPVDFRQRNTQLRVWNALTARDSRSPAFRSRARASEAERVAADFWYIIKLTQGMGLFRRHPSESHNDLYPEVHATLSSEYLALLVGKKAISALDKQGASLGGLQLRRSPLLASCIRS
ncbi:hypothetical protein NBRC10512_005201 [Rhodotorula toruloides]|nr:uncharacterized protein RHTO_07209 [Rhodotorula toruloides NP11]EMS23475.1 hypothetical protein RHTO_07209 [Rhodotorula toruloides NP11]